ncbi:MAG: aminodeoxychorismate synthase component I [Verrucomicrobiota bacterium]|nr:aminodeoxychorismate synthase component I [Verrucomicrobiota bacterium]
MRSRIELIAGKVQIENLLATVGDQPDVMLLHSSLQGHPDARFSFLTAFPMVTLRAFGADCHLHYPTVQKSHTVYGNPWSVMDQLMHPFEVMEELDSPFPLGGCFGYWGYDLKHFVEPSLERRAVRSSVLPDAYVGLFASLVAVDHWDDKAWIVATGFHPDGTWSHAEATRQVDQWKQLLESSSNIKLPDLPHPSGNPKFSWPSYPDRNAYVRSVQRAQKLIGQGDIYQVNLARELSTRNESSALTAYRQLQNMSPAPFSGFINEGGFQILSASPESFLKLDGNHIQTRPIKGTRPRGLNPQADAQLAYELQSSEKERAELLMITDLLRNDLGRVCEYGSVTVPDLMQLERYPQVHHLVSTIEGTLAKDCSHLQALSRCFPGGSITGAPKFRAMQIIEELEPMTRGPYTGSMGYLGFNKTSRLNIIIRTAVKQKNHLSLHVGAGIVADSVPEAEFQETEDKAAGFLAAFKTSNQLSPSKPQSL